MDNNEPNLGNTEIKVGTPLNTTDKESSVAVAERFLKAETVAVVQDMINGTSANTWGDDIPIDEMKVQVTCRRGNSVTVDSLNLFRNEEGVLQVSQQNGGFKSDTSLNAKKLFDQLSGGLSEDILNLPFGIK